MHTVYVLQSSIDNNLYIGCTSDINKRLGYHNKGKVKSTKSRRPLKLIYKEDYDNIYEAFRVERYYKTPKGKSELKKKITALSSNG
ncbi:MAG: GIY-YIG nuclease family protein [Patescibacteria group bacterium]